MHRRKGESISKWLANATPNIGRSHTIITEVRSPSGGRVELRFRDSKEPVVQRAQGPKRWAFSFRPQGPGYDVAQKQDEELNRGGTGFRLKPEQKRALLAKRAAAGKASGRSSKRQITIAAIHAAYLVRAITALPRHLQPGAAHRKLAADGMKVTLRYVRKLRP